MIQKNILSLIKEEILNHYKDNLVSLCFFGSVVRANTTSFSDIDLLIICKNLTRGRLKRLKDFSKIEKVLEKKGCKIFLSPVIKTKDEVLKGSPLYFDMIDYSIISYDRNNFFRNYLKDLKERLEKLGAKRIQRKGFWFWILKEKYQPGEVFSL